MGILAELTAWRNVVEIDGTVFSSISDAQNFDSERFSDSSYILLSNKAPNVSKSKISQNTADIEYQITVKKYMTMKSTPAFDFMSQWNNDIPMPLRTMRGKIVSETAGMVFMNLYADVDGTPVQYCMKCGKQITNPISQFFGMGPECGKHNYINPFESEEELLAVIENYRKNYLNKITWSGWIIKSAILEQIEISKPIEIC